MMLIIHGGIGNKVKYKAYVGALWQENKGNEEQGGCTIVFKC